ncbi:MAG TPA: YfhO family protein, partial [Thermomicrobiales bacterium]
MLTFVIILGHMYLGAKVSVIGDDVSEFTPFSAIAPKATFRNWILVDVAEVVYPHRKFVNSEIQRGNFPLWNPYLTDGQSAAADPLMSLFYPTTVALAWLSAGHALGIEIVLHLFIAAIGMYCLVRTWGGKVPGAVVAAVAFSGCSTLTVWQQYGHLLTVASWVPWLVLCFVQAHRGRRLVWIPLGMLVLGLIILGNDVQWLAYDLIFLGCYATLLSLTALGKRPGRGSMSRSIDPPANDVHGVTDQAFWRQVFQPLMILGVIVVGGFGIGAVQFVPEWQLAGLSSRATPGSGLPYASIVSAAAPPERLLTTLAPNFFGTPAVLGSEMQLSKGNYPEDLLYWGVFPLLVALTAPLWRRTTLVWFLWGFLLVVGSMVYGAPTLHLYALIPKVNLLEVSRMTYIMNFVGAALCGLVFASLVADKRRWRPLVVIGGLGLLGRGILHLALLHYQPRFPALSSPTQESVRWVTLFVVGIMLILAVAMLRWRYARIAAQIALVLLVMVDIARFSLPYNAGTTSEQNLFPTPTVFRALPASIAPPRMVAVNRKDSYSLIPPDLLEVYGIADLGGYQPLVTVPFTQYFRAIEPEKFRYNGLILLITDYTSPLLDLSGVDYFLSDQPLDVTRHRMDLIASGQGVYLYHNLQAAPRAFITASARPVASVPEALSALNTPAFTPCRFATVQSTQVALPPAASTGCAGTATITSYETNVVKIRADAQSDGLLVLSDDYYPGWKVRVDGREQTLYQADGIFRGVQLSAGTHEVEFFFRPESVILGGIISLISLLCAMALLIIGLRYRPGRGKT